MKKVSPPATSDDAASDSDTKFENYVGIWYMILLKKGFCIQKVSPLAEPDVAASNSFCAQTKRYIYIYILDFQPTDTN